jgi:hypothetical protein
VFFSRAQQGIIYSELGIDFLKKYGRYMLGELEEPHPSRI